MNLVAKAQRTELARSAAEALAKAAPRTTTTSALVGFDGFIDSISRLVDVRTSMAPDEYQPIKTIGAFGSRVSAAAGLSTNIERVTLEDRFGGNGPLMAGALGRLGLRVTYIGAVGESASSENVHPVFSEFAARCQRVIPIGVPSHTLCLEFDDGKVMMNDTRQVQGVTWDRLVSRVGLDAIGAIVSEASLLGIVNWSLLGGVPGIWRGLAREVLPSLHAKERRLFVDLSDPAKRVDEDIRGMFAQLTMLEHAGLRVTLGLNLAEATRIAHVLGLAAPGDEGPTGKSDGRPTPESILSSAIAIRSAIDVDEVVIHPREGAAGASRDGARAWIVGPLAKSPRLSTGAGDHFNAGYAFGRVLGLSLEQALAAGVATSGAYVRDARSPDMERLIGFLRELPDPE